jgi:hypothetical protein
MLVIKYDPDFGDVVPDSKVANYVTQCINGARVSTHYYRVGSELILDEFRLRVAQGKLLPGNIEITYKGKTYKMTEFGVILDDGIPSPSTDVTYQIVRNATIRSKARRAEFVERCKKQVDV